MGGVSVFLFILCLDDLYIAAIGVLKTPTIIGLLSISPYRSINICFIYFGAPMLGAYMFINVVSSRWTDPFVKDPSLSFITVFVLKSICVCYDHSYTSFLLVSICIEYLSSSLHIQSMCVLTSKVSLL